MEYNYSLTVSYDGELVSTTRSADMLEMVKPCIDAIDAYYDEDYDRMIDMPMVGDFQILYRGETQAPARAIVDQHHLQFWLPDWED